MNSTPFTIKNYLNSHVDLAKLIDVSQFQLGVDVITATFNAGKKILTCGNGGSASTASHFITDWNKMVNLATGKKFRGISLTDNVGLITAYANDIHYDDVFSGQLRTILDDGDLLVAISGSGNSINVINAVQYANANGANTLSLVGYDGGKLKLISKHVVWVPSMDMQLCEDYHLMFGHMVMKSLCSKGISN